MSNTDSKFVVVVDYPAWNPTEAEDYEVDTGEYLRGSYRVITGIGLRLFDGSLTTMKVAYRLLDPETGRLGSQLLYETDGPEPNNQLERFLLPKEHVDSENRLLCGFGARAEGPRGGDTTTLRIWTKDILPDGTLGNIEMQAGFGPDPDHRLEVQVHVPSPGVIVGVGLRAAKPTASNVTHLRGWYGYLKARDAAGAPSLPVGPQYAGGPIT